MITTYSVNWRAGKKDPMSGLLEVTPDAAVFTPADGSSAEKVAFAEIKAVRRHSSTVELERQGGDPIRIESIAAGLLDTQLEGAIDLAETVNTLHAEHDRIGEELAGLRVIVASLADLPDAREREVRLLATDLLRRIVHHAGVEERDLYPEVQRLLGCGPLVEAMVFEHRAVEGEACELVRIDADDRARFACVFNRLDALVTTHIAKEESIVFPLLEQR
jgi:hemerythrin-like domain-containing protein